MFFYKIRVCLHLARYLVHSFHHHTVFQLYDKGRSDRWLFDAILQAEQDNDQIYQALLSTANEIECISGYHDNGAIFCRTKSHWLKKFKLTNYDNLKLT